LSQKSGNMSENYALCICTYNRIELLKLLLLDIQRQTIQPCALIIVDGNPGSNQLLMLLNGMQFAGKTKIIYAASNHANLPYQRFLGWRIFKSIGCEILMYLDDDLRLLNCTVIEDLLMPFSWSERTVRAVTAITISGKDWLYDEISDHNEKKDAAGKLIGLFGDSRKFSPGELTPSGNRLMPVDLPNHPGYGIVEWFQGRVMVLLKDSISTETYSDDLFAIHHIQLGLGEETFLSRRLVTKGEIICATNLQIHHPGTVPPNAYPTKAFNYGYAFAYSRRFINDYYRGFSKPKLSDRLMLSKTYCGNSILNIFRAISKPKKSKFAYFAGYTLGILRAVFQPPHAKRITPDIDWMRDAEHVLINVVRL
jgi:glycosyltransferase involved in cell wall biosynthesis